MKSTHVQWGKSIVKLTFLQGVLPPAELITSAHGFCFSEGKLLMIDLEDRGWDFPGGHIDEGETPLESFQREAYEEGYVSGTSTMLGALEVNHCDNPIWNENSRYPKVGYQLFYKMDIDAFHPFLAEYEAKSRLLIEPSQVSDYYQVWHDIYEEILQCALRNE